MAAAAGYRHPMYAMPALPISSIGSQVTSGRASSPAVSFSRSPRFGAPQSTYISREHNANLPSLETADAEFTADLAGRVGTAVALSSFKRPRTAGNLRSRSPRLGRLDEASASEATGIGPGSHHPRDPTRPLFGDAGAPAPRSARGRRQDGKQGVMPSHNNVVVAGSGDPESQWKRTRGAAERVRAAGERQEQERLARRRRVEAAILQRKMKKGA